MKKLIIAGSILLMAGTAWAQAPKTTQHVAPKMKPAAVTCDVNGVKKSVKSADECKALGGKVVELPMPAKKY